MTWSSVLEICLLLLFVYLFNHLFISVWTHSWQDRTHGRARSGPYDQLWSWEWD